MLTFWKGMLTFWKGMLTFWKGFLRAILAYCYTFSIF
jgi:hypothetical protein